MRKCLRRARVRAPILTFVALAAPAAASVVVAQQPVVAPDSLLGSYEVGAALPPVDPGHPLVEMTLEEAIERATQRNLDIQTARLGPEMQAYSMQAARAAFTPTFNATVGYNNQTNQSTSQLDGGTRTNTRRQTFNTSITQPLPWYGGRLSANFNNSRTATDNAFSTRNPSYNAQLSFNYTQPLLAGFRTDNQRTALHTQDILGEISDIQLTSRVENITDEVRAAYWNLRATIEQIEIQRQSLAQAQQLLADNQLRVQLGTMAQIQVIQAEAQVANAEQALLNAEVQWRNQELFFKSLLISGADDPLLLQTINPVDLPGVQEQDVDIQAAIEVALRERTDIRQQRQQRQIAELELEVVEDAQKPELNLSAGYSLQGVGGNLFDRSGLGGEPELIDQGSYWDGLNSIAAFDTPTWNLTMNFSYPLGMRAAKANLERARLQMEQTDLALRSQELSIVTQVTNAGLAVRDTRLQLEAAQRSRELAEESAAAEVTRFNAGVATNFEVTAAQDALTAARLSELRALINHINAIAEFERVQRVGG